LIVRKAKVDRYEKRGDRIEQIHTVKGFFKVVNKRKFCNKNSFEYGLKKILFQSFDTVKNNYQLKKSVCAALKF